MEAYLIIGYIKIMKKEGKKYYCYRANRDIHHNDVLIAKKGELLHGNSKWLESEVVLLTDPDACHSFIHDGSLTKIDEERVEGDNVNHPTHYTSHPSGIECIEVTRHYCFSIGNAIKYLWRAGLKAEDGMTDRAKEIEDLKKALWYINDRIKQLENDTERVY